MLCSLCTPNDLKPAVAAYRPNDGTVIYPLCIDCIRPVMAKDLRPLRRAS